jgi:ABC-type uncharacterized transport system permease subunit
MSREMVFVIQALIILFVTAERFLPMIQRRVEERKENNTHKEKLAPSDGGSHED